MKRSDAFPSKYLSSKSGDLPEPVGRTNGAPVSVTIADVQFEGIQEEGGQTKQRPVMTFLEQNIKPLIVKPANWDVLQQAYGGDSDQWRGRAIELFINPNIPFGREVVHGVRVRAKLTGPLSWDQALAQAEAVGLSKDGLVAALKAHGREGYSAKKDTELVRSIIATAGQASDAPAGDDFDVPDDSIPF